MELATWVLNNNYIEFGTDNYYKQTKGTAMGTPFAVTFACIYMSMLEQEALYIMTAHNIALFILMYRYIDDIFAIFHTIYSAKQYMKIFNSLRPGIIKLTLTHMGDSVDILDLVVSKNNRFKNTQILDINLYQKPANKYLYLPMTSFHKHSTYISFITAELKRYRINCSCDTQYNTIKINFFQRLLTRGYPKSFLTPLFEVSLDRQLLLQSYKDKFAIKQTTTGHNKFTNMPLIIKIPNTPRTKKLNLQHVLKYDEFLWADPSTHQVVKHNKIPMITLTKTQNIGSIITESKYKFVIGNTQSN
jgi:hypothetical protein